MGCRNRNSFTENHASSRSSLSEALLFTTMCIVGLPVDAHVKDGSVYSGIFHTASVDADYGIVLKKARMTKKGKGNNNVGKKGLVDTLVIQSGDLVQIIAKGVMLPTDGVSGNVTGDDEEVVVHNVCRSEILACELENCSGILMDAKQVNQSRLAGDDESKGKADERRQKSEFVNKKIDEKIQSFNSSHEIQQVEAVEHQNADTKSSPSDNGLLGSSAPASVANDRCTEKSTSTDSASANPTKGVDLISELHNLPAKSVEMSAPRVADSTRNAKEFKLNPAAKIFSPSFVNPISAPAAIPSPTAANMVYIPNSAPVVPVATIQPEIGFNTFSSRSSAPVKIAQYSNLTVGNGGSGSQFSQPIVGQLAHRTQPLRYATHYTPVLSEPAYFPPSSPVMVGRSTQLFYVQPVSHDLIHGATAIAPVSARPLLNHVQFPKQQGGTVGQAMPVCVPPPVLSNAQQPFALQSHLPVLQPSFPVTRPISVPGPNGFYGTKFS